MPDVLSTISHRPYDLPSGRWRMTQRWNDLLFAHWPIRASDMESLVPASLELDTFEGYAWVGVVPFWMDRVRVRALGLTTVPSPGIRSFEELNLRTYVRSRVTGQEGVFFFSLDAASLPAVIGARVLFDLPYFWARMNREKKPNGRIAYKSSRLLSRCNAKFVAEYSGTGMVTPSAPGTLEHFLTERYCLFTARGSRVSAGHIHHLPWPLEAAEAEIQLNELPAAHGITLPKRPPVLHFARELEVYVWSLQQDAAAS